MTELLYMEDIESNYIREFEAVVERSGEDFVVLDRSAFYPEGGGQPSDTGKISWDDRDAEVVEVEKKGEIIHRLNGEVPEEETEVEAVLDWDRRYEHMKLHTAQHLFSAAAYNMFGASTAGNQIYTDYSRVDFGPVDLSKEEIDEMQNEVNRVIEEGKSVSVYEEKRSVLEEKIEKNRVNLDLLPETIEVLRVIDIDGYDICPCAGTHVRNTEEIGSIEIEEVENKGEKRQRIYYELNKN